MNSTTTPPLENSLRKTFRMYRIVGIAAMVLAACFLGVMGLFNLQGTNNTKVIMLGLGVVITLSGLSGLLLLMVYVAGRHQIAEVDGLLTGETLIAHWRYTNDEHNQLKPGYVYIGAKGIYKDGMYYCFVGRNRQLVKVSYDEGQPAKLCFVYRVISRPNGRSSGWSSQYNNLILPVPLNKDEEAKGVVAEFNQRIKDTLV